MGGLVGVWVTYYSGHMGYTLGYLFFWGGGEASVLGWAECGEWNALDFQLRAGNPTIVGEDEPEKTFGFFPPCGRALHF